MMDDWFYEGDQEAAAMDWHKDSSGNFYNATTGEELTAEEFNECF